MNRHRFSHPEIFKNPRALLQIAHSQLQKDNTVGVLRRSPCELDNAEKMFEPVIKINSGSNRKIQPAIFTVNFISE
jgi:hypothetical protein